MLALASAGACTLLTVSDAEPIRTRCAAAIAGAASPYTTSRLCLGCHDGSLASDVIPVALSTRGFQRNGEHPMLVSYREAYARNPEGLIAPTLINPKVQLENGAIGCLTCHSPTSTIQAMLVLPDSRNGLCVSCHRM